LGSAIVLKKVTEFLNEYLRINAIRRMLTIVDIRPAELTGLILFAVAFAIFEGVGLSLLLPILQYAEGGTTAITESSGVIWTAIGAFMNMLRLPVTLPVLLVLAFIPILLRQVVFYFNTWYSAVVSSRIAIRMRMQTLDTIFNADPEFFTRHSVGQLVGIVIAQTGAAGAAILAVVRQLSIALLMLLYVAILLAISVPLTLVTVAFAGLVSTAVKANFARIRDFGIEAARVNQEMMGKIVERLSLTRLIKLRDQKRVESKRIETFSETMRLIGIKQARLGAMVEVTADPLLMLSVFVTLYVGIAVLGMTLAQLGLLLFILNRLNAKVKEFNAGRQAISTNIAGLLLVKEATEDATTSNRIHGGSTPFAGVTREIVLSDVKFTYPDATAPDGSVLSPGKAVLEDISITIPAGSFTALVGRSGAGKSTLVELLPRLRDVTAGSITFDGVDIKEFQVGSLRKGIGYLTQSAMLFNDTVRENLIYGLDYAPTEEQIRGALERSYATFVYDLPRGLETGLGDRGVRFSGGERQRIGLARVLLEDSSVIILDEPTSSLDSESESYIQQALHRLHGEKTIIVIAHRLATVIQADQLLVIEDGRVGERGTHEELVSRDGSYRKLFETQLLA
jgi:ABC-type multidrug transport system fused ATPase/permease subunit